MSSRNLDLRGRNTRYRAERLREYLTTQDRQSPLKERRKRARIIAIVLIGIFTMIAAYEIHAVSYSPRFTIHEVFVEGAEVQHVSTIEASVLAELEEDVSRYISKRNIFAYPRVGVEQRVLRDHPRILAAHAYREDLLSNRLVVSVVPRKPYAQWCDPHGSECYQMDDLGFIFATASVTQPPTYEVQYTFNGGIQASSTPIGQTFVPGHVRAISSLARLLERAHYPVARISVIDENDFNIETRGGPYLKFSYGSNPEVLVRNLDLIFSSDALKGKKNEVEYVDLRFGNRVYYKLKGDTEQQDAAGQ